MDNKVSIALVLLLLAGGARAVELSPELQLAPQGADDPDITRRPEQPRSNTVLTRSRPELEPLGIRLGSFKLATEVGVLAGYNDNLFAAEADEDSALYYGLAPRLRLRSDWSRHALRVGAEAKQARHRDYSEEDYDDWRVFSDARVDLGVASAVFGGVSVAQRHEDREDANSFAESEMAEYRVSELNGGWSHPFGRFDLRLTGNIADYKFDSFDAQGAVLPVSVTDRDRVARNGEARLRYEAWPGYGVFLRGAYNDQEYDKLDASGITRDSSGVEYGLGVDLNVTDVIFGDAFAGYYRQRYDDSTFDDRSGLGLGANMYWNPTTLTTLHFKAKRSVEETVLTTASGYIATKASLELQHELLRNLLVFAGAGVTYRDYADAAREEELQQYHVAANYMLNRNISLRWRVIYRDQQGNGGGRDFTQALVEQNIVFQF